MTCGPPGAHDNKQPSRIDRDLLQLLTAANGTSATSLVDPPESAFGSKADHICSHCLFSVTLTRHRPERVDWTITSTWQLNTSSTAFGSRRLKRSTMRSATFSSLAISGVGTSTHSTT